MRKPKYIWLLVCVFDSGDESLKCAAVNYKDMKKAVYDFESGAPKFHYEMRKYAIKRAVKAGPGVDPEEIAEDGEEWQEVDGVYYFYDFWNCDQGRKIPVYNNYKKEGYTE